MSSCNSRFWGIFLVLSVLFGIAPEVRAAAYADIYNFAGHSTDGISPRGSLIQVGSTLYGMTSMGGNGGGIIFSFNPGSNSESMVYPIGGLPDGSLLASGATLYGLTSSGGNLGFGTVFSFNITRGIETQVYSFLGDHTDGAEPSGSLIQIGSAVFGTTGFGGTTGNGTIFAVDLNVNSAVESMSYSFAGNDSARRNQWRILERVWHDLRLRHYRPK
jgi:uncharacterized repeat protein (TIGR03803 family)